MIAFPSTQSILHKKDSSSLLFLLTLETLLAKLNSQTIVHVGKKFINFLSWPWISCETILQMLLYSFRLLCFQFKKNMLIFGSSINFFFMLHSHLKVYMWYLQLLLSSKLTNFQYPLGLGFLQMAFSSVLCFIVMKVMKVCFISVTNDFHQDYTTF